MLRYVDGYTKRNQIVIAPFEAIDIQSVYNLAEYYRRCNCIIGMRFHSLIMGINLRIPTIALAGHQQIEALLDELGLSNYCIKVNTSDIDYKIEMKINKLLENNLEQKYFIIYNSLIEEHKYYYQELRKFFNKTLLKGEIL